MSHRKKLKVKDDLSKNPDKIDTERGREYLKQGKVKILSHADKRQLPKLQDISAT